MQGRIKASIVRGVSRVKGALRKLPAMAIKRKSGAGLVPSKKPRPKLEFVKPVKRATPSFKPGPTSNGRGVGY